MLHLVQPVWHTKYGALWEIPQPKPPVQTKKSAAPPAAPPAPPETPSLPEAAAAAAAAEAEATRAGMAEAMSAFPPEACAQRIAWVGVLVLRAVGNSNVGIRSLGLSSLLSMQAWVLDSVAQVRGAQLGTGMQVLCQRAHSEWALSCLNHLVGRGDVRKVCKCLCCMCVCTVVCV